MKSWDCGIQTDLTLTDVTNLFVYKDWYVNESWDAFSNFAKFRKEILKKVKDEYIVKTNISKKKANKKKGNHVNDSILSSPKRKRINEFESASVQLDDARNDGSCSHNSNPKTCEIIVKTNRGWKRALKEKAIKDELPEIGCQAYLKFSSKRLEFDSFKSGGMQTDQNYLLLDKTIQAFECSTIATSTQTLSECAKNSDVSMQFPTFDELSQISTGLSVLKEVNENSDVIQQSISPLKNYTKKKFAEVSTETG